MINNIIVINKLTDKGYYRSICSGPFSLITRAQNACTMQRYQLAIVIASFICEYKKITRYVC